MSNPVVYKISTGLWNVKFTGMSQV